MTNKMLFPMFLLKEKIENEMGEELPADEVEYMTNIQSADDLINYPEDDGTGRFKALVYSIARSVFGLSKHDAESAADDH